ncbi:transposase [Calothrix sp. HK-06]|nr:transposase [Calothrix sp. HK-06]
MVKNHNRDKQAEVLRRTQAQKKEQKKEQVLKAIQEILAQKQPLTFASIANVAGCSISYLYKWDEIKVYIHEIQHEKESTLNTLEQKDPRPHSLKTLHEVAKQRIRELETEVRELKHQNEKLRGHVAEIYELRDECERLRSQLREVVPVHSDKKIVPIRVNQSNTSSSTTDIYITREIHEKNVQSENLDIFQLINEMGIKINSKLKQEIVSREYHKVKLSIEAFQEYSSKTNVENPAACLLSMIRDEAQPNIREQSTPLTSNQSSVVIQDNQKKLISQDKLKQLSNLFNKTNVEE